MKKSGTWGPLEEEPLVDMYKPELIVTQSGGPDDDLN